MEWFKRLKHKDGAEGVVIYVLVLVVLVQTIYPITLGNTAWSYIIYNILYAMLMVSGVLVTRNSPNLMRIVIVLGIAWLIYGVTFGVVVSSGETVAQFEWIYIVALVLIGLFQVVVMQVLLTYVFKAKFVTRDVLFAAIAVYWLLGGFFGSIFGITEGLTFALTGQNAFVDSSLAITNSVTPWQSTLYYSYATLTTLGYGDVLPVTGWARSFASVEAVVGVMYTTIIMARLVGVYMSEADVKHTDSLIDYEERR